jgi:hypothetical protein
MWFFNVRLGYWLVNPKATKLAQKALTWGPPNFWFPGFWQGLLGRGLDEGAAFVELSDGGHFDNTALYELVRRRTKLIVLSEAGADLNYQMEDLANVIERVRADFGVHIRFNVEGFEADQIRPVTVTSPDATSYARRGFALAHIYYPPDREVGAAREKVHFEGWPTGILVYLQATRIGAVGRRVDIDSYARTHPEFPNETTADQFFDEDQLEAYRELGMEIAEQMLQALDGKAAHPTDPGVQADVQRAIVEAFTGAA